MVYSIAVLILLLDLLIMPYTEGEFSYLNTWTLYERVEGYDEEGSSFTTMRHER